MRLAKPYIMTAATTDHGTESILQHKKEKNKVKFSFTDEGQGTEQANPNANTVLDQNYMSLQKQRGIVSAFWDERFAICDGKKYL